eukprot:5691837-Prymnesium_polylepis.1
MLGWRYDAALVDRVAAPRAERAPARADRAHPDRPFGTAVSATPTVVVGHGLDMHLFGGIE